MDDEKQHSAVLSCACVSQSAASSKRSSLGLIAAVRDARRERDETPDIRRDKRGATKIDYHVVTHVHGCGVDVASVVSLLSRLHAELRRRAELEGRRVAGLAVEQINVRFESQR